MNSKAGSSAARTWLNLILAIAAGLVTLAFIQTLCPIFSVDEKYSISGLGEADEKWSAYFQQKRIVDLKNASVILGLLGGALGVAFAVGRMTMHSLGKHLLAAASIGAFSGVLAGISGCLLQQYFASAGQISLLQLLLVSATVLGVLGLGLGTIIGSFGGWGSATGERAMHGLVVGVIAGVAYPVVASVLIVSAGTETTVPASFSAQLLWLGMATSLYGLLLPAATQKPRAVPKAELADAQLADAKPASPG